MENSESYYLLGVVSLPPRKKGCEIPRVYLGQEKISTATEIWLKIKKIVIQKTLSFIL